MKLKGRDFLTLLDYTPEEIAYLLDLSAKLKEKKKAGIPHRLCEGKNIALYLKRQAHALAAALKLQQGISV